MRGIGPVVVAAALGACERPELPSGSVVPDAASLQPQDDPQENVPALRNASRRDPSPHRSSNVGAPVPPILRPLADGSTSSSPLVLATFDDRTVAAIADEDERRTVIVDLATGEALVEAMLPGTPAHAIVDARGHLWLTLRDTAEVIALALACTPGVTPCAPQLVEVERHTTPRDPIALGRADDDATLLVSCGWGRALVGFAIAPGGRTLSIPLAREPRGFAIDSITDRVFVAHAVGSRVSVVALASATVERERELHWRDEVGTRDWTLANVPRFAVQGMAVATTETRVLVPMVLAYPGEPETEAAGYGMSIQGLDPFFPHEPVVVALDREGDDARLRLRREVVAVDRARRSEKRRPYAAARPPCLLPRAVAIDAPRDRLLVACADLGQVVAFALTDRPLEQRDAPRWQLGAGTNAIAVDRESGDAWAWSPFDRRLDRLAADGTVAHTITLATTHELADATGRREFHRPRAFDGRSCASCHIDGRDDGLVWQSPRGLVQTPVLAGRTVGTAPFGWHGSEATLAGHMRRTFGRLRAAPPDDAVLAALAGWIATMPDHHGAAPPLDAAATRGRALFDAPAVGCAGCHADDGSTDGLRHRLGGRTPIDTPSLRFVGDTAPYMHDGRYATLREVLTHTDEAMGSTAALDDAQIADLIAYLRVL